MENHDDKVVSNGGAKTYTNNIQSNSVEELESPNSNSNHDDGDEHQQEAATRGGGSSDLAQQPPPPPSPNSARRSSRTPFTNLSQIDADLALARALQEQERAYMMLQMNNEGSDYGGWEAGSYPHDDEDDYSDFHDDSDIDDDDEEDEGTDVENNEDAFAVHAHNDDEEGNNPSVELDPADFSSDEAYARALQDAEDREVTARLMSLAGINDREVNDTEDNDGRSQDTWGEVDPDELSYEELLALGDVVGCASRGLSADTIASLPSVKYKTGNSQNGNNDLCVICRLDYEDDETLTVLSCKHSYHSECINNWLKINKTCPVCSTEVSTSGNS